MLLYLQLEWAELPDMVEQVGQGLASLQHMTGLHRTGLDRLGRARTGSDGLGRARTGSDGLGRARTGSDG